MKNWKKAGLIAFEIVQQFNRLPEMSQLARSRWLKKKIRFALHHVRVERHPYMAGMNKAFDKVLSVIHYADAKTRIEKMKVEANAEVESQ